FTTEPRELRSLGVLCLYGSKLSGLTDYLRDPEIGELYNATPRTAFARGFMLIRFQTIRTVGLLA
ncbi:MAG TPA: hypothetical protein PLJ84_05095, partial [Bacteroidales bacterium]|nr:hypothetical protein [Bacteroidales bacterium]